MLSSAKLWKLRNNLKNTSPNFVRDGSAQLDSNLPNCTSKWLIAGWEQSHICGNKEYFANLESIPIKERRLVKPDKINAAFPIAKGTVVVEAKTKDDKYELRRLQNVLYVPGSHNIISVTQLEVDKYFVDFSKSKLTNSTDSRKDIEFWQDSGLLYAKFRPASPTKLTDHGSLKLDDVYTSSECGIIWHLRLEHIAEQILCSAVNSNIILCNTNNISEFSCKWCIDLPIDVKTEQKDTKKYKFGELFLINTVKQNMSSKLGHQYSVLLQDKATGFMWSKSAKNVNHVVKQAQKLIKKIEKKHQTKIQTLKFTNAVEKKLLEKMQAAGCKKKILVLAYQHNIDDQDKCTFMKVLERMATIMALCNLPTTLWNFILSTSVQIQNVTPNNEATTAYELLRKRKPSLVHYRIIGSSVIPYDPKIKKAGRWLLVGYHGDNGYVLYNELTEKILKTDQALIFEEEKFLPYLCQTSTHATECLSTAEIPRPVYRTSAPSTYISPAPPVIEPKALEAYDPSNPGLYPFPPPHINLSTPALVNTTPSTYIPEAGSLFAPSAPPPPSSASSYVSSAPHASLLKLLETLKTKSDPPTNQMKEADALFVFDKLVNSDLANQKMLKDILEPFENKLNNFERECRDAVVYSNISMHPRSNTFKELELEAKLEFEPLQTTMNGQCLFNAFAIAIFGNETQALLIRLLTCRHVIQNWDVLRTNSKSIFDKSLQELLYSIVELELWGTEAHIFLLSEILSRPIFTTKIYEPSLVVEKRICNSNPMHDRRPPIYLVLYNDHFEPLAPKRFKIITSITWENSLNFYTNTDHKYVYNGNMNVSSCFHQPEKARRIGKLLVNECTDINSIPSTIDVIDTQDNETETQDFGCLKCKSSNQRLKELYVTNAYMRKKLREKVTTEINANRLPHIQCVSCTELAIKANELEAQKMALRDQFNRHGERLINQINMLRKQVTTVEMKNNDLTKGSYLLRTTLAKRDEDKHKLEQQLVTLSTELEKYGNFGSFEEIYEDIWHQPSRFSPIMTPGRNIPELLTSKVRDDKNIEVKLQERQTTPTANQANPDKHSGCSSRNSTSSNCKDRLSSSSSGSNSSCTRNNTKNCAPEQTECLTPDVMKEITEYMDVLEGKSQNKSPEDFAMDCSSRFTRSKSKDKSSSSSSSSTRSNIKNCTPDQVNILSLDLMREISQYMDMLERKSSSKSPVDLAKDLHLSSSSSSSEVGAHVFKRKKLYVSSTDDDDYACQNESKVAAAEAQRDTKFNQELHNDSETSWYSPSDNNDDSDSDDDNNDGGLPPVAVVKRSADVLARYGILKELRIVLHRLNMANLETGVNRGIVTRSTSRKNSTSIAKSSNQGSLKSKSTKWSDKVGFPNSDTKETGQKRLKKMTGDVGFEKQPNKRREQHSSKNKSTNDDSKKIPSSSNNAEMIRIEQIPATPGDQRQGFRILNGTNSKSFEVRYPTCTKTTTQPEENQLPKRNSMCNSPKRPTKSKPRTDLETPKPFNCMRCGKGYTAKSSLKRHMETHEDFRVPCRLCAKTFSTHENMVKHARRFHSGDRTKNCRFCSHTLKNSAKAMTNHEMTVHYKKWKALEKQNRSMNENSSESSNSSDDE